MMKDDDFKLLWSLADWQTNRRTFVIVKLLLRLKISIQILDSTHSNGWYAGDNGCRDDLIEAVHWYHWDLAESARPSPSMRMRRMVVMRSSWSWIQRLNHHDCDVDRGLAHVGDHEQFRSLWTGTKWQHLQKVFFPVRPHNHPRI